MIVCGHGDVADFCGKYDMVIVENHEGSIESYKGVCRVLVTDQVMSEHEYYFMKGKMLARGVELISTVHRDSEELSKYMFYENQQKREKNRKYVGRCKFGFHRVGDEEVPHEGRMKVVKRILSLHDAGCTYRAIRDDEGVRHTNGDMLSISTIQLIVKNREYYEKER